MFNLGSLGSLFVSLSVDTAKFEGDMGKAAHAAQKSGMQIEAALSAIGPTVAAAAAATAGALALVIKNTIDTGDQLSKMSARTGFTVERLSELEYGAKLADVSVGQLQTSLGAFSKAVADAHNPTSRQAQLFKALGVDISQGVQPAFDQFMERVQQLPNHETKVAAMRVAFGRAGESILTMAGDMDKAAESARKLGIVMSTDMAKQSGAFKDNMTKLGASAGGFAMAATNEVLPALVRISDRLVQAAERGEKLKGVLAELARMGVNFSPLRFLPGVPESVEALLDSGGGPGKGVSGKIRRPNAGPDVNAEMAACVLAGGKWVNGKCVTGRSSSQKKKELTAEQQFAAEYVDEALRQAQVLQEADALTRLYTPIFEREAQGEQIIRDVNKQIEDQQLAQIDRELELEEIRMRAAAGFDASGNKIKENLKDQKNLARDLGLTFQSAFEDAVISGKKFREVLEGIGQDLARLILRKTVTEPLGNAASGFLSRAISGIFGGGGGEAPIDTFIGGHRSAGQMLMVGEHGPELFVPDSDGTFVPNYALGGGGGNANINVSLNVGSLDPRNAAAVILANEPVITAMFRRAAKQRGQRSPV